MADTLDEMVEVVKGFVGDSGVCSSERAIKAINQARRLLWNKREWNNTAEYFCVKCANSCFTLPNRYEQIRLAWINGESASLADEWFNATQWKNLYNSGNSCHRLITEAGGYHVLFRDYTARPYQIAVMAEKMEDAGVKLLFETQNEYQSYQNVEVTAENGPSIGKSTQLVTAIRTVSKPKTYGRIRVYAYDPVLDIQFLIAIYQPTDVNPVFRRFQIPKNVDCMTIYASKRFYDVTDPLQLVEFSADAMIYAVLALNSRENRKAQEFLINLDLAIKEEEKVMEGEEIPTAAPLRIANFQRPENLIGNYLGSPSADDYFFQPSWP
jgi:hypothetical protein